ncbi:NUDIX hydrolase [Dinghuibacter silviterrae]|nr:NUDIX hydrolase [Dinghuibacter silviterrae]
MPSLLDHAKRIQALAQIGLTYSPNPYDLERYEELREIALQLMHEATGHPLEKLAAHYGDKKEYVTPKVDVRGVVFEGEKILLVKESADGLWSLPGGWADVGYTPKEVVAKEIKEETGLTVTPTRLLAVLDKRVHAHPPALEYTYKLFIECVNTSGTLTPSHDILDCGFFDEHHLPPLSLERVTPDQINLMYAHKRHPELAVTLD